MKSDQNNSYSVLYIESISFGKLTEVCDLDFILVVERESDILKVKVYCFNDLGFIKYSNS